MLASALRDTANAIFDVDSDSSDFVMGLSTPLEMKDWAFEILEFDQTESFLTFSFGEIDAVKQAQTALTAGGSAFLLIYSGLLENKPDSIIVDHWIVFLGGLKLDDLKKIIVFECYSCGQTKTISRDQEDFSEYMFGTVTAI